MANKIHEEFCELLDDQLETIAKKGDISPTEMDNAYKAIKSKYYLTVMDEMKEAKERGYGEYSQRGGQGYSGEYSYNYSMMPMSSNMSNGSYNSYERSYNSYEGQSNARRGRDGDGDGRYSEEGQSNRRGRDAMGRYTSRDEYSRHDEKEQMRRSIEEMQRKLQNM